jgi:hypothetical protein
LTVRDVFAGNVGTLASWALVIRFAGDQPLVARPFTFGARRIIPVVAHLNGAAGAVYRSDLVLFNRAASPQSVTAILTPSGADGTTTFAAVKLQVAPGEVVTIRDVVPTLFATSGSGALELQGDPKTLLAWSALYDEHPNGRLSQTIESVPPDSAGAHVFVMPATRPGGRTNLGISEVAGEGGVVRVTLRVTGFVAQTFDVAVPPFSHVQMPLAGSAPLARLDVVSGASRIVAYASRIDGASGDPVFVPSGVDTVERLVVPVVAGTEGVSGTRWSSELWADAFDPTVPQPTITLWQADGTRGPTGTVSYPTTGDLVVGVTRGQLEVTSSHSARFSTDILDASRRGDRVPAQPLSDAIGSGQSADAIGIQSNGDARTNFGAAEVLGGALVVRFTTLDAAGNELASFDRFIGPREQVQFPVTVPVTGGRIRFRVIAGSGGVLAYASIVDNRSQDTTFLPAR